MPLYKPSELHQFLNSIGIHPKKGLSQNFLIDGNIIRKIVETAQVKPGDLVLEIGPGPGSLTEALLAAGANVIAVEKDPILAKALERLQTEDLRLKIFCEDIMEFPIAEALMDKPKAKVIANLPYHLTTPIIARFSPLKDLFSKLVVMVQEEVARRFAAKPKTSEYSSFSVFLNFYSNPVYAFTVSRNCFYPSPKVDSAVVSLELKTPPSVSNQEHFFIMTRTAFEHRRKMLRGSLKELYATEAITESLIALGLNPKARPEELSLNEFIALFESLQQK